MLKFTAVKNLISFNFLTWNYLVNVSNCGTCFRAANIRYFVEKIKIFIDLICVIQGCGSRDLVLVSRPIKTTFFRSLSRPCWSWPPWSWSRRVVLSKIWGYVQPQRYLCWKSKLASECAPLFVVWQTDFDVFVRYYIYCSAYSNVDEWKLFVCAGRDQDSKGLGLGCWSWSRPVWSWSRPCWSGLGLGLGLPGLGLGLDHAGLGLGLGLGLSGLGLVFVSDSLVLITSVVWFVVQAVKAKRPRNKKPRQFKSHNEHLGELLEDYSEKLDKWLKWPAHL